VFSNSTGVIYRSNETLTTSDTTDYYPLTVSGSKKLVFQITSANPGYVARICPYNPSTGSITFSGPYVFPSDGLSYVSGFNSTARNDYCVVVFNNGSTYGASCTLGLNVATRTPLHAMFLQALILRSLLGFLITKKHLSIHMLRFFCYKNQRRKSSEQFSKHLDNKHLIMET
jgi:hypothetical protein